MNWYNSSYLFQYIYYIPFHLYKSNLIAKIKKEQLYCSLLLITIHSFYPAQKQRILLSAVIVESLACFSSKKICSHHFAK